jgi:hypothetical protein
MQGVYSTYGIYLPTDVLVWLGTSELRLLVYRLQSFHAAFRLAHMLSMATFFGSILLLDLRLIGLSRDLAVRQLAPHILPWTYASFAVVMVSGTVLFLFDPIQVASHTWFLPTLLLILAGMLNAVMLRRGAWNRAVAAARDLPPTARLAGAVSATIWLTVIACASLNASERPLKAKRTLPGAAFTDPAKAAPDDPPE